MVTRPVIDNSADTITLNRSNVVLFRQLFKQFKNENMLNMEFCMMHLRIHLIPTNEVAKVLLISQLRIKLLIGERYIQEYIDGLMAFEVIKVEKGMVYWCPDDEQQETK